MRILLTAVLFLTIPSLAAAQQADDVDAASPTVQLEQSTAPATGPAAVDADLTESVEAGTQQSMETRDAPVEDAATVQEPGSRNWWWIVGAVVVGGLIVALLL